MAALIKKFFHGLLYIVVLPALLVVLAVYSVVGLFMFFVIGIKGLILFFTGRNIFGELPEDIRAREILEAESNPTKEETNSVPEAPTLTAQSGSTFGQVTNPVPPGYPQAGQPIPPGYVPPGYYPPGYVPPGYPPYGTPIPPGYSYPPGYVPPVNPAPTPTPTATPVETPVEETKKEGEGE